MKWTISRRNISSMCKKKWTEIDASIVCWIDDRTEFKGLTGTSVKPSEVKPMRKDYMKYPFLSRCTNKEMLHRVGVLRLQQVSLEVIDLINLNSETSTFSRLGNELRAVKHCIFEAQNKSFFSRLYRKQTSLENISQCDV